jgi:hypothetical protein
LRDTSDIGVRTRAADTAVAGDRGGSRKRTRADSVGAVGIVKRSARRKARTYTERMFLGEEIGSLGADDARGAFEQPLAQTPVTVERGLSEQVVEEVEGYPYFVQLWGAELWDAADAAEVDHFTHKLLGATREHIFRRLDPALAKARRSGCFRLESAR